jgi:3,4-dihydroxy-2-butanone 4-phosphate synthase
MTRDQSHQFATVLEAIEEFQKGNFLIVVDDVSRENEGDLIIPAQDVDEEKMAFMIRYTRYLAKSD